MPRPKRCRRVCCDPEHRFFKPQGIPVSRLECIDLALDGLEALRLSDVVGLSQMDAAKRMDISQPTFNRILNSARNSVSRCVTEGFALRIDADPGNNRTAVDPEIVRGHGRR
ncbi:MAG: DUF134 domain-containing protein, partial [Candidatus Thermoplasmatota archaeon]|nr:DUF134 domain-containing protein [Candidatus Thermoplasmatota archaeon]